ncbi:PEP-CTERM sorting domain-containing protein [Parvularcula dongshanensis]|uniref:TSP C-terminal domain-containing protein n=1 Tax=Parvularcula dongshanensis TaxID=1173995 RepID=A0A840I860_9PROT|nr:PEP-CTERM sorting domain-containing protein [Parvularcula dongshanensis]MBB4660344.1 hypothetical protein [Parvularcula dongshanensis]
MKTKLTALCALSALCGTAAAAPVAVDLSSWTAEGQGTWTNAPDNNSVVQTVNGIPGVYFNGVDSQGQALSGTIEVQSTGDDDYIGFVLGYNAGDIANEDANYILIDWKQGDQNYYGGLGRAGLAISRVTGALDDASGAWWHDAADGVEELARANTLGDTGWEDLTVYNFDLVFTEGLIQVFVDDVLEISLPGVYENGSFGFYNYSQANVRYGALTQQVVDPDPVPLPAAAALFAPVLFGGAALRRRAKRAAA